MFETSVFMTWRFLLTSSFVPYKFLGRMVYYLTLLLTTLKFLGRMVYYSCVCIQRECVYVCVFSVYVCFWCVRKCLWVRFWWNEITCVCMCVCVCVNLTVRETGCDELKWKRTDKVFVWYTHMRSSVKIKLGTYQDHSKLFLQPFCQYSVLFPPELLPGCSLFIRSFLKTPSIRHTEMKNYISRNLVDPFPDWD